ncbi:MAG TPA: DNA-3-methyladenine glycosylase [Solirubrobacteraceae bacterium]|jgi:DNA-3-methyladenine glycosylase|nr:DNA-3-methyladenine glycosylase [Solirubrobacteraceae bacterium]
MAPLGADFYARPVLEVARELIGCTVAHGGSAGVIVETEAYHEGEPACHAFVGLTERTRPLFGPPGRAYVYRSYGIHAMLNAVCEPAGIGAAVLIRALRPVAGIEAMRARRGPAIRDHELCSGPGRLTQALGIGLELNDTDLQSGPVRVLAREPGGATDAALVAGPRVGITRAPALPWRFAVAGDANVSRPRPGGGVRRVARVTAGGSGRG